jgi:hypothetical protein
MLINNKFKVNNMYGRKKIEESKEVNVEPKEVSSQSTSRMFSKLLNVNRQNIRDKEIGCLFGDEVELSDQVQDVIRRLSSNDPELKELNLKKWEITIPEKKAIFNALAFNNTVAKADFTAIDFTEIDAENFVNAFKKADNRTLKFLILNYNELGDDGIEKIIRANLKLSKLVAMCCDITDLGAEKIAQYADIPDICLNQNAITENGVLKMIENKSFSELTFLALGSNPIRDTTALDKKIASFSSVQTNNNSHPKLG